uniref:Uncharacterized protein n=1 Tax=Meloidogyne enterolobii TaxID=390850 RepID=A0A6V7UQA1_MELEN|nr:unnamed protein product [Meloidogyne enterolobii]
MQSKQQNKKLPPEMLVDIFKSTEGAIMENLLSNLYKISSMSKQKEFEKDFLADEKEIMKEKKKLVEEWEAKILKIYEQMVKLGARRRLLKEYERLAGKRKRWNSCQIVVSENGGTILRRYSFTL